MRDWKEGKGCGGVENVTRRGDYLPARQKKEGNHVPHTKEWEKGTPKEKAKLGKPAVEPVKGGCGRQRKENSTSQGGAHLGGKD